MGFSNTEKDLLFKGCNGIRWEQNKYVGFTIESTASVSAAITTIIDLSITIKVFASFSAEFTVSRKDLCILSDKGKAVTTFSMGGKNTQAAIMGRKFAGAVFRNISHQAGVDVNVFEVDGMAENIRNQTLDLIASANDVAGDLQEVRTRNTALGAAHRRLRANTRRLTTNYVQTGNILSTITNQNLTAVVRNILAPQADAQGVVDLAQAVFHAE